MNVVRFEVVDSPLEHQDSGIRISIDHVDLIDLVRNYEAPFAEAEGHPDLAGQYAGISPGKECDRKHSAFLGTRTFDGDGRGAVLTCGDCGEVGCWPLLCRVEVGEATVTWSDFLQPHRLGRVYSLPSGDTFGVPSTWDYAGFGPFVFDREQYLEAAEVLWTCDGEFDPYFDRIELAPGSEVGILDTRFSIPEGWTGSQLVPIRGLSYPGATEAFDLQEPTGVAHDLVVLAYPPGGGPNLPAHVEEYVRKLYGDPIQMAVPQVLRDLAQGGESTLTSTGTAGQTSLVARIPRNAGVLEIYATGSTSAVQHVRDVIAVMAGALATV